MRMRMRRGTCAARPTRTHEDRHARTQTHTHTHREREREREKETRFDDERVAKDSSLTKQKHFTCKFLPYSYWGKERHLNTFPFPKQSCALAESETKRMHRAARALFSSSSRTTAPQKSRPPLLSRRKAGSCSAKTFGVFTVTTGVFAWSRLLVSMSSKVGGSESFTEYSRPPPFVVETGRRCDKAILFLHGLGDTGRGWSDIPNQSSLGEIENVRWVFPNAPVIPITLNGGMAMPGWFDMNALERDHLIDDKETIEKASRYVDSLIEEQMDKGIPAKNIVVGGFSQGGAIALTHAMKSEHEIGGYVGLSTYLPMADSYSKGENGKSGVKVFQAHGTADPVLRFDYGTSSSEKLKALGMDVQFESYGGMAHSACAEELDDLKDFLSGKIFNK